MMRKTPTCTFLAYCETTGGPVCICSLQAAQQWQGSEQADSLYWTVTEAIGTTTLLDYPPAYTFFNTETGNFAFFKAAHTLVLVEIVSIEEEAVLPWRGIEFSVKANTHVTRRLNGLTCFFDSSLSLPTPLLAQEALYAIDQEGEVWNTAVLACAYDQVCEVTFVSDTMRLDGICFYQKTPSS